MMELEINGRKGITVKDDNSDIFHDKELEKTIRENDANNKQQNN